jgi:hypothetical protein
MTVNRKMMKQIIRQREENLERSPQTEVSPELEEQQPYFEATEPVFQSKANLPNAAGVPNKSVTPPRPKISPLAEQEVVVETWQDISKEVPQPTYQKEKDNNGKVPTVLQPAPDIEVEQKYKLNCKRRKIPIRHGKLRLRQCRPR